MSFFDKIKGAMGTDDLDYDEYEGELFDDDTGVEDDAGAGYDAPRADAPKKNPAASTMMSNNSSIELKVVKPDRYDNVTKIADHLLNRRTVVLNLENTNKETARRLIDFLSGVAYSIDGQLKRVANNTFVITPHNVEVSGDQMKTEPKPEPEEDLYSNL